MKGENVHEFLDYIYYFSEAAVAYAGKKYMFSGFYYFEKEKKYKFWIQWFSGEDGEISDGGISYDAEADTREECFQKFLTESIIDGKTFWEIEKDFEIIGLEDL